jgi:hypothetical protein
MMVAIILDVSAGNIGAMVVILQHQIGVIAISINVLINFQIKNITRRKLN